MTTFIDDFITTLKDLSANVGYCLHDLEDTQLEQLKEHANKLYYQAAGVLAIRDAEKETEGRDV